MNLINIWRLATTVPGGGLIGTAGLASGVAGLAYGVNQNRERCREQRWYHSRLAQIEAELASKEQKFASLDARMGDKNEQVRILAAENTRLRQEAALTRRSV